MKKIFNTFLLFFLATSTLWAQRISIDPENYKQEFQGTGASCGLYIGHYYSMSEVNELAATQMLYGELKMNYVKQYDGDYPWVKASLFDKVAIFVKRAQEINPNVKYVSCVNNLPNHLEEGGDTDSNKKGEHDKTIPGIMDSIANYYFHVCKGYQDRGIKVDILELVNERGYDDGKVTDLYDKAVDKLRVLINDPDFNTTGVPMPLIAGPATWSASSPKKFIEGWKANRPNAWANVDIVTTHAYENGTEANHRETFELCEGKPFFNSEQTGRLQVGEDSGVDVIAEQFASNKYYPEFVSNTTIARHMLDVLKAGGNGFFAFLTNTHKSPHNAGLLGTKWGKSPERNSIFYGFKHISATHPVGSYSLGQTVTDMDGLTSIAYRVQGEDSAYVHIVNLYNTYTDVKIDFKDKGILSAQVIRTDEFANFDEKSNTTYTEALKEITVTATPYSVNTVKVKLSDSPATKVLQSQAITFVDIVDKMEDDHSFTFDATSSSGLPVNVQVVSGPASIKQGRIKIEGIGQVKLMATQSGDNDYEAAPPVLKSFRVLPQGDNVALNKPVTASSEGGSYPASKAVDGNISSNSSRWITPKNIDFEAEPQWIEIDLQAETAVHALRIYTGYNGYKSPILEFDFQVWVDGAWETVLEETDNFDPEYVKGFTEVTTQKVRLYMPGAPEDFRVKAFEIEVYGTVPAQQVSSVSFTFGDSTFAYNGKAQVPTVEINPADKLYTVTFPEGEPILPGKYKMKVVVDEPWHEGSDSTTVTINKLSADISLTNLNHTYDGTAKEAGYTVESELDIDNVMITYDGEETAPTTVGDYTVVATIDDDIYEGSKTGKLTISAVPVGFTFGTSSFVYNGQVQKPSVITNPADIQYTEEFPDGEPKTPGSYEMNVSANQEGYTGEATAMVTITKAEASITLTDLTHTYDGSAKEVGYEVDSELDIDGVSITYGGKTTVPTEVGEYEVKAIIEDDLYQGEVTGTLSITSLTVVEFTFGTSTFVYNGEQQLPEVTVNPVGVKYKIELVGGNAVVPGEYTLNVSADQSGYTGSETTTVIISKAEIEISLTDLMQVYDGTAKDVGYTLEEGKDVDKVEITYDGQTEAPAEAGSYAVKAVIVDDLYEGEVEATLIIKRDVSFTFGTSTFVYNGDIQVPTVTTDPKGVQYKTDFPEGEPVLPGTYPMTVSVDQIGYEGSDKATVTITKAPVTVTLTDLVHSYDGTAKAVDYTLSSDVDVEVVVTYGDLTEAPTEAGSYAVKAVIVDDRYEGETEGTLIIKRDVSFTFGTSTFVYNGDIQVPTVTTDPEGVQYKTDFPEGEPVLPGTYPMTVSVDQIGYEGSDKTTVTITKAPVTITLTDLAHSYDGTAKAAGYTLSSDVDVEVVVTYGDLTEAPTEAGSYAVKAVIVDDRYEGEAEGNLIIEKKDRQVIFTFGTSTFVYNGEKQVPTVTTDPEGVQYKTDFPEGEPVLPGTYSMTVSVDQIGYEGTDKTTVTITKAPVTITLTDLVHSYNGTAKAVDYTLSSDVDVEVVVTYDDLTEAPIEAGSYAVKAVIVDDRYEGEAEGTLIIEKKDEQVSFTFGTSTFVYTGEKQVPTVATDPEGVQYKVDFPEGEPVLPGTYPMTVSVDQNGYEGSDKTNVTITKAPVTVTLTNLTHLYDGTPKSVGYEIEGGSDIGNVVVTYGDLTAPPTEAGTYTVVARVVDDLYEGEAVGTFTIEALTEVEFSFGANDFVYIGEQQLPTVTTEPEGINYKYEILNGDAIAAGEYTFIVTADQEGYTGKAEVKVIIKKAEVEITLTNLVHQYDGASKEVSYTLVPNVDVETVVVTYDGKEEAPVEAGEYSVEVTIEDANYKGTAGGTLVITKPTSIDALNGFDVKIFPSLSQGIFTVEGDINRGAVLEVYTLSGSKVYSENLSGQRTTVTLPDNLKGIYLLKVTNKGLISIQRHLIQK